MFCIWDSVDYEYIISFGSHICFASVFCPLGFFFDTTICFTVPFFKKCKPAAYCRERRVLAVRKCNFR